jgi:rubrerythrin
LFDKMAVEEDGHRHRLTELYQRKFGEHIPLIRREDVKGFLVHRRSWIARNIRPDKAREEAAVMEIEARRFYEAAARRSSSRRHATGSSSGKRVRATARVGA